MTRAEPRVDWDLAWERCDRRVEITVGFRRCWSSPVRVRRKMFPRFSKVHMVDVVDDFYKYCLVGLKSCKWVMGRGEHGSVRLGF